MDDEKEVALEDLDLEQVPGSDKIFTLRYRGPFRSRDRQISVKFPDWQQPRWKNLPEAFIAPMSKWQLFDVKKNPYICLALTLR